MKKILFIFLFILTFNHANARSEKEIEIGVFLEDLKDIGKFDNISNVPKGLFPANLNNFHSRSTRSQNEVGRIFVQQKGLMEKYPDRLMKAMAYFEFFYMNELKNNKKTLERFESNYPNVLNYKNIQKLHNLNKARKTMREAIGLSINESPEKAVSMFYTMHLMFKQSNLEIKKLSKEEKKRNKLHKNISKEIGKAKSLAEKKFENRILDKKFNKDLNKIKKNLSKVLSKAEHIKEYELLSSFIIEVNKLDNPSTLTSGYRLAGFIMNDIKKNNMPKKFNHDLTKAKFDNFTQDQLKDLGEITKASKLNKNIKSNDIQLDILNLENGGMPVNKLLDVYRKDIGLKFDDLNLQLASSKEMSRWALSDWANAWKSPIPKKVQKAGIEVSLSSDEIESVKAQLAMQNFQEILNVEEFKNFFEDTSNFESIQDSISSNFSTFSFTLDDFAKALGDIRGLEINNYADLTALANAQHGANWSVEEYTSAYSGHLEVVKQLQSGDISSFDAGQIAGQFADTLQEVADTVAAASAAGVSVDLEAVAQGAGFDSFAAAVAAYNEQYGTSYTVDQAREALGQ